MSEKKQLNDDELEKVSGGGIFFSISEITRIDFTSKTVQFKTKSGKFYNAKVINSGIKKGTFCSQTAYFDVYELHFAADQNYFNGWYKYNEANEWFSEYGAVDSSGIFSINTVSHFED